MILVVEIVLLGALAISTLVGLFFLGVAILSRFDIIPEVEAGRYCGVCGDWLSDNDERVAARTGETRPGIHDACAVALAAREEE